MDTTTWELHALETADDADAVFGVYAAYDTEDLGEPELNRDEFEAYRTMPHFRGWYVERDGSPVAGATVFDFPGGSHVGGDIRVLPGAPVEVYTELTRVVVDAHAAMLTDKSLHLFACDHDAEMRAAFEAAGGTFIRTHYRMEIDTPTVPRAPVVPAGVEIRTCDDSDADRLLFKHIRDESFSEHFGATVGPDEPWLEMQRTMNADTSLWWLATVDGSPAAALRAKVVGRLGWVDNLGTLEAFRGRGLATTLLRNSFAELAARGCTKVGLGVDAGNVTPAVHVYESAGMRRAHEWVTYEMPRS